MIVLTTPTGDIGSQVLRGLLDSPSDEPVRVVVRDPARLASDVRERVDVVTGSHGDAEVIDGALDGASALFWCVPPDRTAADLVPAYSGFTAPAARAITAHGVGHVVSVSALGRGTPYADRAGLVTASLAMDDLLASTGAAFRALANPTFMDNLLREVDSIRDDGVFTDTGAPDRVRRTVATRDIAATAVELLLDRSWSGSGEVPVLGPEDLSPADMAAIMSDVLGREVTYRRQGYDDLAAAMARFGAAPAFVDGMVDMMRAKDEHGLDFGPPRTSDALHPARPTSFRTWCEDVLRPAVAG